MDNLVPSFGKFYETNHITRSMGKPMGSRQHENLSQIGLLSICLLQINGVTISGLTSPLSSQHVADVLAAENARPKDHVPQQVT